MTGQGVSAGGHVLLVGCGNMGGAMLRGWLRQADEADAPRISVITPHPERVPAGVPAFASPSLHAGGDPDVIVLAVKPAMLGAVAPPLQPLAGPETSLLSVLAAVDLATLRRHFPRARSIVRAVPNLPAAIGVGATALAGDAVGARDRSLVTRLCAAIGSAVWLDDERALDAATTVSGCGPAFLFRFADAVIRAGEAQGLPPDQARRLFAQTMIGAGAMLAQGDLSAAEMARRVASPGGVTLAGLAVLDDGDALAGLIARTLTAAAARNAEMARAAADAD